MCQITVIVSERAFSEVSKSNLFFGISIASVIQSTCMTAEHAVLKGRHHIWIDSEEIIKPAGVCSVLVSLFSFAFLYINLNSPKAQETQVQ